MGQLHDRMAEDLALRNLSPCSVSGQMAHQLR